MYLGDWWDDGEFLRTWVTGGMVVGAVVVGSVSLATCRRASKAIFRESVFKLGKYY